MNFNTHLPLDGQHAFLSPSKYHWLGYDEERMFIAYERYNAVTRGTVLHDFAKRCIELGQKLPKSRKSLNSFVNDAIGFRLTPEQVLYYSPICFGTTDAIGFHNGLLRIHDLKTGITPASVKQLEIYAALFCLEYRMDPKNISMELRLYQLDEIVVDIPEPDLIQEIINKIQIFDKALSSQTEGMKNG
jgi:hypothetical protein